MLSRSLEGARAAFRSGDLAQMRDAHSRSAPERHEQEQGQYIKSVVYGGLDGIITTFAVVAGVAGASLSSGIILILGFANLLADGLSMAIGDYLSTKAENEYNRSERTREQWEVEHYPEGEKQELFELYVGKGISADDARQMTDILARYSEAWVDTMMVEELGIVESDESPFRNAVATFVSFGVFGFIPLVAFVASAQGLDLQGHAFGTASAMTGAALFCLGALKVRITQRNWFKSGLEMLVVGGLAAVAAYGTGALLAGLA